MNHWTLLGIAPTTDRKAVKKAYAALLKQHRPDLDPEGYQRLREAFDRATAYCRQMASPRNEDDSRANAHTESAQGTNLASGQGHPEALANSRDDANDSDAPFDNDTAGSDSSERKAGDTKNAQPEHRERRKVATLITRRAQQREVHNRETIDEPDDQSAAQGAKRSRDARAQAEQQAYDTATAEARLIFGCDNEDQAISAFEAALHHDNLLHLKTRAYFENICLHALVQWDSQDMPYGLITAAAREFRWFQEQHADPEKRQRVAYLEARLNIHRAYLHSVVNTAEHGQGAEKKVARLILGKKRPAYFHLLRFVGRYNRKLRKITGYFAPIVEQDLCPEINTDSFRWWHHNLERCLFSAWHLIVGLILLLFFEHNFALKIPANMETVAPFIISIAVVICSIFVWGINISYSHYRDRIVKFWQQIQGLRGTDLTLSATFILAISLWRYFHELDNIGWLIPLALLCSTLLYGRYGTLMILLAASVYALCYYMIDVLETQPQFASYALIVGFLSHRIFLYSVEKMPTRMANTITHNTFWFFCYHCTVSLGFSLAFLLVTLRHLF